MKTGGIMDLFEQLRNYRPYNEQEAADLKVIKMLLASQSDIFTRENLVAHMSASSWLLNRAHDKVLMIYHNIYDSWAWTGGHADGERDLLAVAVREAQEETGVTDIHPVSSDIFSVEEEVLRIKPDENSGVRWFLLEEALKACSEPWMRERIYTKLNAKLRECEIYENETT